MFKQHFICGLFVSSIPCLEDESEVLLSEDDPGRVSADSLQVNIHHHQICAFLVRVVLHKLQVHHRLRSCSESQEIQ